MVVMVWSKVCFRVVMYLAISRLNKKRAGLERKGASYFLNEYFTEYALASSHVSITLVIHQWFWISRSIIAPKDMVLLRDWLKVTIHRFYVVHRLSHETGVPGILTNHEGGVIINAAGLNQRLPFTENKPAPFLQFTKDTSNEIPMSCLW